MYYLLALYDSSVLYICKCLEKWMPKSMIDGDHDFIPICGIGFCFVYRRHRERDGFVRKVSGYIYGFSCNATLLRKCCQETAIGRVHINYIAGKRSAFPAKSSSFFLNWDG